MNNKKLSLSLAVISGLFLAGCGQQSSTSSTAQNSQLAEVKMDKVMYPVTKKGDVVDEYFGTKVPDPYRWLEDDMSAETADWVKAQNKTTQAYLSNIPYREKIEQRLSALLDYEKVGMPFIEGDYSYFYKNDGLQNQYVLYRQKEGEEAEVFLDPNTFSDDGTVSLSSIEFTKDGSLAVYLISEGGSDWRKAKIIDTKTKKEVENELIDIKFSGLSWVGNEGFYYSSYDKPKGSELSAKTDQHKLYYHKLGTPQSQDTLIFGGTEAEKHRYVGGNATEDGKYLIVSAAVSTSGNRLFIKDLTKADSKLIPVVTDTNSDTYLLDSKGDELLLVTNMDAPNKRVVKMDAANPAPTNWVDVIPETENVLSVSTGGGYLFAKYMRHATSFVQQFDLAGNKVRDIELPEVGTAGGFWGKKSQDKVYYSFSNQKTPSTILTLDVSSGESSVHLKSKVKFNSDDFESKQIFYTSKDGTKVPMIITHKKGIKLDGSNPTILYGYGGFNVSLQPQFSSTRAAWLELGGVYAVANLRGGGEYGKKWHDAGTQLKKQNVFDDFIGAAEYLIKEKVTSSEKLAVMGGSNGGLLVGAVMTQRPELFKVALPAVGVLDMLRYHTFTSGAGWAYDYGTSEDNKEMFNYLLGYSPVHNVKAGVEYPATLVTTGDHDDRVVPAHSFKFAAELQAKQAGSNPTLIRIETDAGHGAGTPISKTIEQYADIYGFTLYNMGVKDI
ncbi:prolyl oligopeptidase family serine peptidase [Psychrosphaera sp. F3M07]|uniref:prolyl oligopeptidase family serine peptidase n=1 Tax=Psychrosphaera sp. F3M07 TaxID=2841560 RepID=UPI001C087620|nr:prolyl oligopeptidase family serine peptidase [Psychrosphaera sp. F3M07]MBU2916632.1 prolyl oligopeptidase family serine peptidase [Psychrosphaera sp. F3M07]